MQRAGLGMVKQWSNGAVENGSHFSFQFQLSDRLVISVTKKDPTRFLRQARRKQGSLPAKTLGNSEESISTSAVACAKLDPVLVRLEGARSGGACL